MAVFLYYGEFSSFSDCENWIASAIDRSGHHCVRWQRQKGGLNLDELAKALVRTEAKVLLLSKTPELNPEGLRWVRDRWQGIVAFWTFDWMLHPETARWYLPLAQAADICFQTDGWWRFIYHQQCINRVELHQGLVPGLHEMPRSITKEEAEAFALDVAFIGSIETERRRELLQRLNCFRFAHYGKPGRSVWGRQFALACFCSKIIIGDNYTNYVAGYWSDRVYLTLGCGGFFMTAYVRGLEAEFKNHEHLVWWNSFDELNELIGYYLPREADRHRIAKNGHDLVHSRDTYDHRVAILTETVKRLALERQCAGQPQALEETPSTSQQQSAGTETTS